MPKDLDIESKFQEMLEQKMLEQEMAFELKLKQREENLVSLGCTVVDLIQIDGKPILDKETGKQKEINGEFAFYPNKYICKLSFTGGEIDTPISLKYFESLIKHDRYLAKGRLGDVKEFGTSAIKPIFSDFIKI